jgi:hypothetical protein
LPGGQLVVQTREPAALFFPGAAGAPSVTVALSAQSRRDTGHDIFHADTGSGIACASCHPEAGDDGHLWSLRADHRVRTQSLRGGLLATAPFHWDGSIADLAGVMRAVFVDRMSGPALDGAHSDALARWLDAQPLPATPPPLDAAAVARGEALFRDPRVGCDHCHGGPQFTSNRNEDVGTGGAFQVPSLRGVRWRAPYMHTGCARTLLDRFSPACGGGAHGDVSGLTPGQLADLVEYMRSL